MKLVERKDAIDNLRIHLQMELVRIANILQGKELATLCSGYCSKYIAFRDRAELKNRMIEARRDMVRLEKLLYGGTDYEISREDN